jgi:hypothetical protein
LKSKNEGPDEKIPTKRILPKPIALQFGNLLDADVTLRPDAILLDDSAARYLMSTLMQPQLPKGASVSGHANAAFS